MVYIEDIQRYIEGLQRVRKTPWIGDANPNYFILYI